MIISIRNFYTTNRSLAGCIINRVGIDGVRNAKNKFLIGGLQKFSTTLWKYLETCVCSSTSCRTRLLWLSDNRKEATAAADKINEHFISSVNNSCSTTTLVVAPINIRPSEISFLFAPVSVIDISAAQGWRYRWACRTLVHILHCLAHLVY